MNDINVMIIYIKYMKCVIFVYLGYLKKYIDGFCLR